MCKTFLLALALCLLLAAPGLAHGSFVYVSNYGDGTISQFRANPNGTLTPLDPPSVRAHSLPHSLAADPAGRFLYVTSARDWKRRDCVVSQYRIASDGRLAPLSPAQVLVPGTPATVTVEPSGKFAYVFNREGTVAEFRIGKGGRLSLLPVPVIKVADAGGVTPIVGFDAMHHVLYGSYCVAWLDNVTSGTFACSIKSNGQLHQLTGIANPVSTGQPQSISVTPNGRFAYVSKYLLDMRVESQWRSVIAQYRTRPGGILSPLSPATVAVKTTGLSFIEPEGHFLYVMGAKVSASGVTARFRLGHARLRRSGTLGPFAYQTLNIQAVSSINNGYSLAFAPSGRFCYFVEGNYVYLFRRNAEGPLSPLRRSRMFAGYGPLGVICVHR